MESNFVHKTLYIIGSLSIIPAIAVVFFSFSADTDIQFDEIQTGTSIFEIKKEWGMPDEEFIFQDSPEKKVTKYTSHFGSYVFIFNRENLLVDKYFDD